MFFNKAKELDYKREEMLKIQEELARCRNALTNEWADIEHNYHSSKQVKETEIARLDALIEAKKAILAQDNATCQFLKTIIENMSKQPIISR
jgi:L-lactate utilization protein LutB